VLSSDFPTNILLRFSSPPCVPISFSLKPTNYEAPHCAVSSSLPPLSRTHDNFQIFFSAPLSQTSSIYIRSSLRARDQVSHTYKTTGKIIITYILMILERRRGFRRFWTNGKKHFVDLFCPQCLWSLSHPPWVWAFRCPNRFNCVTFVCV
jgi:hypothetical protein